MSDGMHYKAVSKCILILYAMLGVACSHHNYNSLPHYNLNAPVAIKLPNSLSEISGIAFRTGNAKDIYAIEDEHGKLYKVNLATQAINDDKFGAKDDYEDLAFAERKLYVLTSNGTITAVTFNDGNTTILASEKYEGLVPKGEYEGLSAQHDTLYVLCKHCASVDAKNNIGIYLLKLIGDTAIAPAGTIIPSLKLYNKDGGTKKEKIYPAALAKNPVDDNWYVLSSVNKTLLVFNARFEYLGSYPLSPAIYEQPEGIAFSQSGDMYISNEGHAGTPDILMIKYSL